MSSLDRSSTVAQIVLAHAAAARVFQKHQIDFCCRGDVTVPDACRERALDPEVVFAELEATVPSSAGSSAGEDPRALGVAALLALIIDRHHGYLRRQLPYLGPLVSKVARVHGERNAELVRMERAFRELVGALEPHLEHEETVLFPALMASRPDAELARAELAAMHEEHLEVGDLLRRIRGHAGDFVTPEWGCNTYHVVMRELEALEMDILRHVHLETHVLTPRFVEQRARP